MRGKQMKITVLDRCTVTAGDVSLAPIEALGNVRFYDTVPHEKLADVIADSDAVICNKAQITDEIMEKCKKLRYIGLFATGYNNIDIAAAKRRGITVWRVGNDMARRKRYGADRVKTPAQISTVTCRGRSENRGRSVKIGNVVWRNRGQKGEL